MFWKRKKKCKSRGPEIKQEQIKNGMMGLLVGDALGVPVEFKRRDTFEVTDMVGGGVYDKPPGYWSDDGSLALATLESMLRLGWVDTKDIMENFCKWLYEGKFSADGKPFGVGRTTRIALDNYKKKRMPVTECGGGDISNNGNGALMRILPVAMLAEGEPVMSTRDLLNILRVADLTHKHIISNCACLIYAKIVNYLMHGETKENAVKRGVMDILEKSPEMIQMEYDRLYHLSDLKRDSIKSSGYVVHTLEAALWCFLNGRNYREVALLAVNLGDDTDTTAAVAGGLAGIYYGCGGKKGIPKNWLEKIPGKDGVLKECFCFGTKKS